MKEPMITLTELDYYRLSSLLEKEPAIDDLENEIERARVVDFPEVPTDLVTMNTRFTYLNVTDDKICEMTIVYPPQANVEKRWISITAPLGAALIGLREGDEIDWTFPDGKTRTLRILSVIYQPEANSDFHL